jgi:mono/diheme cytochrome c family protein
VVKRSALRAFALTLCTLLAAALLWALWGFDAYYRPASVNPLVHTSAPENTSAIEGSASRTSTDAQAPSKAQVERGQYLARVGNCVFCHTAPSGAVLAGGRAIQTPFGTVHTSNLTRDPEHGLGRWTQDDFWQALHLGLGPQGQRLSPAFPYTSYSRLTRADADALWAFLQSVPAVPRPKTDANMVWPFGTQTALGLWRAMYFRPFQNPHEDAAPAGADPVVWTLGRYLVEGLGHCQECHSPRDALGGLRDATRGSGGVLPGLPWYAPSLRDAAQAGATDAQALQNFLQTGLGAGRFAAGPMAEVVLHGTQYLNDQDAQAMAVYLQSLVHPITSANAHGPSQGQGTAQKSDPAIASEAKQSSLPLQSGASGSSSLINCENAECAKPRKETLAQTQGADMYKNKCADCHGENGQGRAGIYPAMAGNRALLMDKPNNAVLSVLYGGFAPSTQGHTRPFGMPPFMLELSNAQIAQVLSYTRSAWGNQAAPISELQVQAVRDPQQRR